MAMLRFLCLVALAFIVALPCGAYKSGMYYCDHHIFVDPSNPVTPQEEENHQTYVEIRKLMESADRQLFCTSLDQIDIGLGPLENSEPNGKGFIRRHRIYFKRDEIQDFLRKEKHKQLLVAGIYPDMKTNELNELNGFLDSLGYRRILVLRMTSDPGFRILRDTQEVESHLEDQNSDDCLPSDYHRSQPI
jgi:hypothetical protein